MRQRVDTPAPVLENETAAAGGEGTTAPPSKTRSRFEFQFHYKNQDLHIIQDLISCADYISKINGSARGLPVLENLEEFEAYQDCAQAS